MFFHGGRGGGSASCSLSLNPPPPPPPPRPSLPPSQMTAVSLGRAVIDDQFSLPKLTERLQDPGGYQYFVVEK